MKWDVTIIKIFREERGIVIDTGLEDVDMVEVLEELKSIRTHVSDQSECKRNRCIHFSITRFKKEMMVNCLNFPQCAFTIRCSVKGTCYFFYGNLNGPLLISSRP